MFWGLSLKPSRKYSQITAKSFHISNAALENGDNAQVYVISEKQKYLICTLDANNKQVAVDLNFEEGEDVCLLSSGNGSVSLIGYLVSEVFDEDSEDDDISQLHRIANGDADESLDALGDGDDSEDGDEDDDDDDDDDGDDDGSEEDDEENDIEDSDDEDDEEEEDEIQQPKAKKAKVEDQPKAKENGAAKPVVQPQQPAKKDKKAKKQEAKQQPEKQKAQPTKKEEQQKPTAAAATVGGERTVTGNVKIQDLCVGKGPEAKQGSKAAVFYVGRLKTNNKVFDSTTKGKPFKFAVGGGDVIRGWDVGVVGMKVGGKRRITCPPHMAYGARGAPPAIPPNSTLVFDVELKGVN